MSKQKIVGFSQTNAYSGDIMVKSLVAEIRANVSVLFKICEGIAVLDMLSGFAQLVTVHEYSM